MSNEPHVALARAIRQNAATLGLLGVDFMPVRRCEEGPATQLQAASTLEAKPPAGATPAPEPLGNNPKPSAPRPENAGNLRPATVARPQAKRTPETVQTQLDELRSRYEREAPHKNFVTDHHNIVFGEGDPCARLMFVGEAPGAEEDRVGRPFVGRSGQLLDKMIAAMGLSREKVYIANVLKTRPPDNATPTSDECAACAPYLYEQIMIIRPEVVVTLGLPASRTLLNSTESMTRLRGQWHQFRPPERLFKGAAADGLPLEWSVPLMPTYHPAFLLRSYTPENRAKVWSDLQQVIDRLGLKADTARTAASAD